MSHNVFALLAQMGALAKAVAVGLLGMSIYSMTVMAERLLTFRRARRESREFASRAAALLERERSHEAGAVARGYPHAHLARVVAAGLVEFNRKRRLAHVPPEEALEAARRAAERASLVATAEFKRGTGGLATIGATAPFVGLFGTVIGIIDAFAKMAAAGSGGLAVVASGIAEALVTTAAGLAVALPAVWSYNVLMQRVERFAVEMSNASSELIDRLVEELPERRVSDFAG